MKKRLLAWLLSLNLMIGLLPVSAMAAEQPSGEPKDNSYDETATVGVEYGDVDRTTATITYHKPGVTAPEVNLIFLVDISTYGKESHEQFETMMRDSGVGYLYDYGVATSARVITYQHDIMSKSGIVKSSSDFLNAMTHGTAGEGTADEEKALQTATQVVGEFDNSNPTVVFWVLGKEFGVKDSAAIGSELTKLKTALGEDGALITWQMADAPSELLTQYANQYTDPHDGTEYISAYAESDPVIFRSEMASSLEQVLHDHYHNIRFTLELDPDQTLVTQITDARLESETAYISYECELEGNQANFHLDHVCRQAELDFVLEVKLDPNVYAKQTVIPAKILSAPADHSNGGLHEGIFDEKLDPSGLTLDLPAVTIDRTKSSITFLTGDAEGAAPAPIQQLVGTTVTIPDSSGLTMAGSSFGGWNVVSGANLGHHYAPGEIISMPAGDMVLEAAFGHVEVNLEIDYEQGEEPDDGNQMAELDNTYNDGHGHQLVFDVTIDDKAINPETDIVSVSVIDYLPEYDTIKDPLDPLRVNLIGVNGAVYARHIGATSQDKVVAYLKPSTSGGNGKYDLVICGPGGVKAPESCAYMFGFTQSTGNIKYFAACETISLDALDTSNVNNMSYMFYNCENLQTLTFGENWDTSNVNNMSYMFNNCANLAGLTFDGIWDTSNVTDMSQMFYGCSSLAELTFGDSWNTSKVESMEKMFNICKQLKTLTFGKNWDTSNVDNMSFMFASCNALTKLDLSSFDTSEVLHMDQMFNGCSSLTELKFGLEWDTSKVTNMNSMFRSCEKLESLDVSGFNTSNVEDMNYMFAFCSSLTSLTFEENWDTSNVDDMSYMFNNCSKLGELNLSMFDTSMVENMAYMFYGCSQLTDLTFGNSWTTPKLTNMTAMFSNCSSLNELDLRGFNTSGVKAMTSVFNKCSSLDDLDLSSFDTSNVTIMDYMFKNCSNLTTLNLGEKFNISKVTSMAEMFSGATVLATIDGTMNLGEENDITSFSGLFSGLSNLTSVPLNTPVGGASFPSLSIMSDMFKGCSTLTEVDLSDWTLPNLTNTSYMFSGCTGLETIDLSWSGLEMPEGNSLTVTGMFDSVSGATLDIGDDISEPTQTLMQQIQTAFDNANAGATQSAANGINELPQMAPSAQEEESPADQSDNASGAPQEQTPEQAPEQTPEQTPEQAPAQPPEQTPEQAPEQTPDQTPEQAPEQATEQTSEQTSDQTPEQALEQTPEQTPEQAPEQSQGSLSAMPLSMTRTSTMSNTGDNGSDSLYIHKPEVKAGDTITYKVTVKYVGGVGVKSGQIALNFPIPKGVMEFIGSGTSGEEGYQAKGWYVSTTEIKYSGESTGYMGGRVVEEPKVVEVGGSGSGQYALQGVFEGLYTGTEVMVSIKTTVDIISAYPHVQNGINYAYIDGTAYATDSAATGVSRTVRLWSSETGDGNGPTEAGDYSLTYKFEGDVPGGVQVPEVKRYAAGAEVTVENYTGNAPDYYTFEGWYRSDDTSQTLTQGDKLSMPAHDLTLIGKWSIDESKAPMVKVVYEYSTTNVPNGAPTLPSTPITVLAGTAHPVIKILTDADHHVFEGWKPKLTIAGNDYPMPAEDDKVYSVTVDSTTYTIDLSGTQPYLQTEQFRDAAADQGVTVTFSGAWRPYTGTIKFDANGGESTMSDMTNVTWDDTRNLSKNTFTSTNPSYSFAGWAFSPGGQVVLADEAPTAGLIDEKDKVVTLYAVWKRSSYDVSYDLTHVTSSNDDVTVDLNAKYNTTLTPDSGYEIKSVSVKMNGVELAVNSTYYNPTTGEVTIPSVNGDIVIRATAEPKTSGGGSGGGSGGNTNKYPIIVDSTGDGTATSDKDEAAAGEDVTITTDGKVENITVTDKDGNEIPVTDNGDGSFTFEMPDSEATVKVEFGSLPEVADPNDTGVADWLNTSDHISYLNGYPDGSFRPDNNMTRAEVAQMFYNLLLNKDVPITASFTDVSEDAWYAEAVNTLASLGLVVGVSDGEFAPDRPITRAEFTTIGMRFTKGATSYENIFTDVTEDDWFYGQVVGSIQYGWINGYADGTFRPNNTILRSEVTTITNRMLGRSADQNFVNQHMEELRLFPDATEQHWAFYQIVEATNAHDYSKDNGDETWMGLN